MAQEADLCFSAFDQEYLEIFQDGSTYEKFCDSLEKKILPMENKKCKHKKFFDEEGLRICCRCGKQLEFLTFEPEWKFYNSTDSNYSTDTSRCHKSKIAKGGIDKVFQASRVNVPEAYKKQTEEKCKQIVNGETVRGRGRIAIVAASLLHVFRENGDCRTQDDVRHMFNLEKNKMSDGMTKYFETFPKDRLICITPSDLIRRTMKLTGVDFIHFPNILKIAKQIENTSFLLEHSCPQSVASAIIYLYLCTIPEYKREKGLTKSKFAEKAKLSDITVAKLVKEASNIVGYVVQM